MRVRKEAIPTAIAILVLIAVGIFAIIEGSDAGVDISYGLIMDSIFFTLLALFLYWKYESFNQNIWTHSFLMLLIISHVIGAIWFYGTSIGGIEFDLMMHFFGGMFLYLFFHAFILKGTEFSPRKMAVVALLLMLGLSAVHEMIEFVGYGLLGEGEGVFMYGAGDFGEYQDVSTDMIANLVGGFLAAFISGFLRWKK